MGERFTATVVDRRESQLGEPAVRARCDGEGLEPGRQLSVRLVEADPARRLVRFAAA